MRKNAGTAVAVGAGEVAVGPGEVAVGAGEVAVGAGDVEVAGGVGVASSPQASANISANTMGMYNNNLDFFSENGCLFMIPPCLKLWQGTGEGAVDFWAPAPSRFG